MRRLLCPAASACHTRNDPMQAATLITGLQLSIRAGAAAGLAVAIAMLLGLEFPLYSMIAAVIITDLSPSQTRQLGLQRMAGTVLGAGLGAALSSLLLSSPWVIGLGIMVTIFLCHLLRLQGAAKVAGYICAIVVLDHSNHPWFYAFYRLIETALGIGVAVAVSFVPKLMRHDTTTCREPY